MAKKKADDKLTQNEQNLYAGMDIIKDHRLFGKLDIGLNIANRGKYLKGKLNKGTAALTCESGDILLNPDESRTPGQWAYIIAHCMLHLCFGHFESEKMPGFYEEQKDGSKKWTEHCDRERWNTACDIYIAKFLADIKFPGADPPPQELTASDERKIYDLLCGKSDSERPFIFSTAAHGKDMFWNGTSASFWRRTHSYAAEFAFALADSVRSVIDEAGGKTDNRKKTVQEKAAEWFIAHYPLLGALASAFRITEVGFGSAAPMNADIGVAAINVTEREIYVNTAAGLDSEEWKFVLAHEYLHAGLMHHERCEGRDPYLWNVACDFVINGWLHEMQIGKMPVNGGLYDESIKECSAEEIYDIIVSDIRRNSKYQTFRGNSKCDILDKGYAESKYKPVTLDDFCRSALRSGLEYHTEKGRGYIPAGLIEEIRALSEPPIPWDVELAKWFEDHFEPVGKKRTYARPSRRQSSTPDIPRPSYLTEEIPEHSRTYGVIIDTSGSMSPEDIGLALGAVVSYSVEREVPLVRVVFCDAAAYDAGWIRPDDLAGTVEVKGRGGTVIQPAVDLLERDKDFPKDGPILIITDGMIEKDLTVHHEHAFMLPRGYSLPFRARGKVFYFSRR